MMQKDFSPLRYFDFDINLLRKMFHDDTLEILPCFFTLYFSERHLSCLRSVSKTRIQAYSCWT